MGTELNAVAIITARGGSKRIPGKNIKEFMGKPMLVYGIEAALQSGISVKLWCLPMMRK